MVGFLPGVTFVRWPRTLVAMAPGRSPQLVPTTLTDWIENATPATAQSEATFPDGLNPFLVEVAGDPLDPVLLAQLEALDRRYLGWRTGYRVLPHRIQE